MRDDHEQIKREIREAAEQNMGLKSELRRAWEKVGKDLGLAQKAAPTRYDSYRSETWQPAERAALYGEPSRDLGAELRQNDSLQALMRDRRGAAVLHVAPESLLTRTVIHSGTITPAPSRQAGIVPEARRTLRVQELLTTIPTSSSVVEWISVGSHAKVVSPQAEGAPKAENEITFERREEKIRTIATWIPATKQILEDIDGLENFLTSSLAYAVAEEFEDQLLFGSGSGENLNGLYTQAAAFNTALLGTSWTRLDVIGRAIQQLAAGDEMRPDFLVVHPQDYWAIMLSKDQHGRYLIANPQDPNTLRSLFDLAVAQCSAMAPGTFLLGTTDPRAAVIRMRQPITIEISTEHADYFTRNMVAIRAEMRAALLVMRPSAFIKGNLTSSPA